MMTKYTNLIKIILYLQLLEELDKDFMISIQLEIEKIYVSNSKFLNYRYLIGKSVKLLGTADKFNHSNVPIYINVM